MCFKKRDKKPNKKLIEHKKFGKFSFVHDFIQEIWVQLIYNQIIKIITTLIILEVIFEYKSKILTLVKVYVDCRP